MCIPFDNELYTLAWSPFSDNILFANDTWLIDLENQASTQDYGDEERYGFGYQPDQFVGYGRYLWNKDLQTPSGVIELHTTISRPASTDAFAPVEPATIESAQLEYCALSGAVRAPCQQLLDITTHFPRAFVYDWQIATNNMMVWLAAESNSDEPIGALGINRDQYADTVLYMTDLTTLETREIFRLSELGMENVFSNALDWSPDGTTIALNLSDAISTDASGQQLLILHLEW
jgi:hypothetical protein